MYAHLSAAAKGKNNPAIVTGAVRAASRRDLFSLAAIRPPPWRAAENSTMGHQLSFATPQRPSLIGNPNPQLEISPLLTTIREGQYSFGARYYDSSLGRFLTPDWSLTPEAVPYANLAQPQSLNLYAYEGDNPTSSVDKDGHCWPWCTALAGAVIGAAAGGGAEAFAEYWRGQPLNKSEIEHAAIGGAISGAIIGAIGPEAAPEAGLDEVGGGVLRKIGGAILGNLVGGAAERKLNGQAVANPKALGIDAAAGAFGGAAAAIAAKAVASTAIREAATDAAGLGTFAAAREMPSTPACKENSPCPKISAPGTATPPTRAGGGPQ